MPTPTDDELLDDLRVLASELGLRARAYAELPVPAVRLGARRGSGRRAWAVAAAAVVFAVVSVGVSLRSGGEAPKQRVAPFVALTTVAPTGRQPYAAPSAPDSTTLAAPVRLTLSERVKNASDVVLVEPAADEPIVGATGRARLVHRYPVPLLEGAPSCLAARASTSWRRVVTLPVQGWTETGRYLVIIPDVCRQRSGVAVYAETSPGHFLEVTPSSRPLSFTDAQLVSALRTAHQR